MNAIDMIGGWYAVSKYVMRVYGAEKAVFLSKLVDNYTYFRDRKMLDSHHGFFCRADDWEYDTGQSYYTFAKLIKWAEEKEFLVTRVRGVPAKKYFYLDEAALNAFVNKTIEEAKAMPRPSRGIKEELEEPHWEPNDDNPPQSLKTTSEKTSKLVFENSKTLLRSPEVTKETPPTPPLARGEEGQISLVEPITKHVPATKTKPNLAFESLAPTSYPSQPPKQTMQKPVPELSGKKRTAKLGAMSAEEREEYENAVEVILNWYREQGKEEDQTRSRGKQRILDRLLDGWDAETLLTAIKRYVWSKDQEYRESVGRDAHFLGYLDELVNWEERIYTPKVVEDREDMKVYRKLKAQYQTVYGDKWERELHKTAEWLDLWEKCKKDFQKMDINTWEQEVYGDWEITSDPSLCPGKMTYVRDYDDESSVCQNCPCNDCCKSDLERHRLPHVRWVVDQLATKKLWKEDWLA